MWNYKVLKNLSMKTLVYNRFGGTEVLELIEVAEPTINSAEILVKVKNVSLNPIEWKFRKGELKMMSGKKFPQFVGGEFSGIIEKVGSSVSEYKIGDEVFGFINRKRGGAIQEKVAVTSDLIVHKPQNVSFETASAISVVGIAAMIGLFKNVKMEKGQKILINGCTGNMGILATQIAKSKSLIVTGVCGTSSVEFAKQIGCDKVIDYKKEDVLKYSERYDIIFDTASTFNYKSVSKILMKNGVFLNPTPNLPQILGSFLNNFLSSKKHKVIMGTPNKSYLQMLANYVSKENFVIPINKVFPFESFKEAYDYAEKGGITGKVILSFA